MKRIGVLSVIILVILALSECSPKAKRANSIDVTVTSIDKKYVATNFSTQQLEEGKMLFTNNCGRCHRLFAPETFTVEKWNHEVTAMLPKTRLTPEEGVKVRAYVVANAQ